MLCPRCEQGDVIRGIIRSTNEMIYVCQECEASWSKAEDVGTETFFDFGTYMVGLGLNPLWTELELDFAKLKHHFHLEILAPNGLAGIEPYLFMSLIPLTTYFSHFTQQVILRLSHCGDKIEFEMDGSSHPTMHASGYIVGTFEDAIQKIDSLSQALRAADFPHTIGVDDDVTHRSAQISYRARITTHWE